MLIMNWVMKGLDKIDEQRDAALDHLIQKTTYFGLDGKSQSPGKPNWATVYASLKRNEDGREAEKKDQPKGRS